MADLALVWDGAARAVDLVVQGGNLALDADGLESAVLSSLFSDARVDARVAPPDGSTDRRGWWSAPVGSSLWLLARAKGMEEAEVALQDAARQALAWLVEEGRAQRISVRVERQGERLALCVAVDGAQYVFQGAEGLGQGQG